MRASSSCNKDCKLDIGQTEISTSASNIYFLKEGFCLVVVVVFVLIKLASVHMSIFLINLVLM